MYPSTHISVVLVEDDGAVRRAVADGLGVHGFDVTAVPTAEEALALLRQERREEPVDLLVVDVGLPGMSGTELCEQLRRANTDTPIVILSARDAVGERQFDPRRQHRDRHVEADRDSAVGSARSDQA